MLTLLSIEDGRDAADVARMLRAAADRCAAEPDANDELVRNLRAAADYHECQAAKRHG